MISPAAVCLEANESTILTLQRRLSKHLQKTFKGLLVKVTGAFSAFPQRSPTLCANQANIII